MKGGERQRKEEEGERIHYKLKETNCQPTL